MRFDVFNRKACSVFILKGFLFIRVFGKVCKKDEKSTRDFENNFLFILRLCRFKGCVFFGQGCISNKKWIKNKFDLFFIHFLPN
jgi:hypothetical protein